MCDKEPNPMGLVGHGRALGLHPLCSASKEPSLAMAVFSPCAVH